MSYGSRGTRSGDGSFSMAVPPILDPLSAACVRQFRKRPLAGRDKLAAGAAQPLGSADGGDSPERQPGEFLRAAGGGAGELIEAGAPLISARPSTIQCAGRWD